MSSIVSWGDIADHYADALLLGNGSSIAVHGQFSYASLYGKAISLGHVTADVQDIFDQFGTGDFELVLQKLWHAHIVNAALGVSVKEVEDAYSAVRAALIQVIGDVHVRYPDLNAHLNKVCEYLARFKNVVSLNYDLIVYWGILFCNGEFGCNRFKDGFTDGVHLETDLKWLYTPHPPCKEATLVVYPHGNLMLAQEKLGGEIKITRTVGADLLDEIIKKWGTGDYAPIFVSEGESFKKVLAIHGSNYLSQVYHEILPELGSTLVIYGWGVGDQDQHILLQVSKNNFERVAVSVLRNGRSVSEIYDYCAHVTNRLNSVGISNIQFFDASSPGCWIY